MPPPKQRFKRPQSVQPGNCSPFHASSPLSWTIHIKIRLSGSAATEQTSTRWEVNRETDQRPPAPGSTLECQYHRSSTSILRDARPSPVLTGLVKLLL